MSNPPPYPSTTLTEKFTALAADVEEYIAGVNLKLDALTSAQAVANTALLAISAALAALNPIIQQAADCACAAATSLEDAPWNEEPPPDPVYCDDPEADPEALTYTDYIGTGETFWPYNGESYMGDWSSSDIVSDPKVSFEGFSNLILLGPGWYKVDTFRHEDATSLYLSGSSSNDELTPGFTYTLTTATQRSDTFFVAAGQQMTIVTVLGIPGGDPTDADQSVVTVYICSGENEPS